MARTRVRPGSGDPGQQMVNAATTASVPQPDDVPILRGQFIAPAGGRYRWWTVVDCMAPGGCGGQHMHADRRRPGKRGWLRCCVVTGAPYRVHPNPQAVAR